MNITVNDANGEITVTWRQLEYVAVADNPFTVGLVGFIGGTILGAWFLTGLSGTALIFGVFGVIVWMFPGGILQHLWWSEKVREDAGAGEKPKMRSGTKTGYSVHVKCIFKLLFVDTGKFKSEPVVRYTLPLMTRAKNSEGNQFLPANAVTNFSISSGNSWFNKPNAPPFNVLVAQVGHEAVVVALHAGSQNDLYGLQQILHHHFIASRPRDGWRIAADGTVPTATQQAARKAARRADDTI